MYQIPGQQISFRLDENEKSDLNNLALKLQEESNVVFTNSKQIILALLSHSEVLENNVKTLENEVLALENKSLSVDNKVDSKLQALIDQAKIRIGYEGEDVANEVVFKDLLEVIKEVPETVEATVIEKEVIKEVPRALGENEVVVGLKPDQKKLLEVISDYRFRKNLDPGKKTLSEVMVAMTFNIGSLVNEHEYFKTGISYSKARNVLTLEQ